MRIHYLQHVAFEDAGNIADWAEARGHTLTRTRLDLHERLPSQNSFDWLVVMGGPMNIYEHDDYPWLVKEKEFIRRVIDRGAPLLGVCLGAQLAACVLGGKVTRNRQKEIGWFQVALTRDGRQSPLLQDFPSRFLAFHWHGDTFSIPPEAKHLASSEACTHQAFQYGDRVVGLQFHLDYTADGIQRMVQHCGKELIDRPSIQKPEEFLASPERIVRSSELLFRLLDSMQRQVTGESVAQVCGAPVRNPA